MHSAGDAEHALPERIGQRLLFSDASDFEQAIAEVLEWIGASVGADRCSLGVYDQEQRRIEFRQRWHNPELGVDDPEPCEAELGPDFPWLSSRIQDHATVRLTQPGELPAEAAADRRQLKRHGVRSLLMVPLSLPDRALAAISLSTIRRNRVWSNHDQDLLESARGALVHALQHYRAEQRTIDTERHYRNLIENSLGIVFTFDRDGRYTYLSPSVTTLTGYPLDEVIGHRFDEFVHPDDARRLLPAVQESLARNRPTPPVEYRIRARDGAFHWHRAVLAPVRDRSGRLSSVVASALDVSDLHRESELRRLLIHLATRFINLPLDQYDAGIQSALAHIGFFVGADRAYVFDYDLAEDRARNTHEWCVEGVAPGIEQSRAVPISEIPDLFRAHQAGEPVHIAEVSSHPDENLRRRLEEQDIQSLLTVPLLQQGECVGFVGFDSVRRRRAYSKSDIELLTVFGGILVSLKLRKDAESRLSETTRRLRQIVDGTNAGTWEWRPTTGNLAFNQRFAAMLGHASPDEL
ncbi:MAG: GAF domain-containing protein, partial [Wenzhouxiangella sp.]|nr:GAF domain-containing protein [Wenzhouxiangella sp.]